MCLRAVKNLNRSVESTDVQWNFAGSVCAAEMVLQTCFCSSFNNIDGYRERLLREWLVSMACVRLYL